MKPALFIFAILVVSQVSGQSSVRDAKTYFADGNYAAAYELFEQALQSEPDDPNLNTLAGECLLNINVDRSKAVTHLKKAVAQDKYPKNALYLLAEALAQNYAFDEAITYYTAYLETVSDKLSEDVKKRIIDCQTAKELMNYPIEVTYTNMGDDVNSEHPDYNVYTDAEETMLLFTSRRDRAGAQKEFDGFYPADIYESRLGEDRFQKADLLNTNVNSRFDDLLVGLSADGNKLIIYYDDVEIYGDLFTCERSGRTFSRKQEMDWINSLNDLESGATFSPDGSAVVFASNRPGGYGMSDLFITRKLPDGNWSEPQNLGPEVNTPMREDYPQFSPDGRYLYFASDGHPGMGGFDLYLSEWNMENNVWTRPKNLGYPLNTPRHDRTISFNAESTSAYVSTWRPDSKGDLDIYRVDFGERHNLPALVRVQVPTGERENPFISAEIRVTDKFDELVGVYRPHPESGKYVMALNPGKYFLYVDAEGYEPYSELLMISDYYAQAEQNIKTIRLNRAD